MGEKSLSMSCNGEVSSCDAIFVATKCKNQQLANYVYTHALD